MAKYLRGDPKKWGDEEKEFCGRILQCVDAWKAGEDAHVIVNGEKFAPFAVLDALVGHESVGALRVHAAAERGAPVDG